MQPEKTTEKTTQLDRDAFKFVKIAVSVILMLLTAATVFSMYVRTEELNLVKSSRAFNYQISLQP